MTGITTEIVEVAKVYVIDLLEKELPETLFFHSKDHTLNVLRNVETIGIECDITDEDLNLVRICALFHDVGYVRNYENHEVHSTQYAKTFLELHNVDTSFINQVVNSILATKVPQQPYDKISEILCDADLMHLTYDNYFEHIELMRQEWALTGRAVFNQQQFAVESLKFFSSHHYHTEYGIKVLTPLKEAIKKRIYEMFTERTG
jgi:uncharacterized protein